VAEPASIARPYAKAVFEIAQAGGDLDGWSEGLRLLAVIASDARVVALAKHPEVAHDQLSQLVIEVAGGDQIPDEARRLVRLLAENDRLLTLPEIAAQFDALRAEAQSRIEAEMLSARPVDAEQQRRIVAALEKRLGRRVTLTVTVQEDLLGGAVIRAGDLTIDGSARGKLAKLAETLSY
jgi:F-type H+-transporting ATPase subunit delta